MPTNGSYLLWAPLIRATKQGEPTVVTDTLTISSNDTAERPEPLEIMDRIIDRIDTAPPEELKHGWQ